MSNVRKRARIHVMRDHMHMGFSELKKNRERIIELAARHGAHNVRVFGSVARDESSESSDVDFLVEFDRGRSLFDQVRLTRELKELLNVEVDLQTPNGLYWFIKDQILEEAKPL